MCEEMSKQLQEEMDQLTWEEAQEDVEDIENVDDSYMELGICESDFH
jgi:hypothetical protein